jgi:hypothetical protein
MRRTHILSQKASHQHEKCQHTDNPARASALSAALFCASKWNKICECTITTIKMRRPLPLYVLRGGEK